MIDVHCHLEQKDYDSDRDKVIEDCKKELRAVISSSPYMPHFKLALEMHEKYKNFVFISLAVHPVYASKIKDSGIENAISFIRQNKEKICAVGETGLEYFHVKDEETKQRQKEIFLEFIDLANELEKPLVVHCRDAFDDCLKILEENAKTKVLMHLFSSRKHIDYVLKNGWSVSIGPSVYTSKDIKKIARDIPLDKIMLETDSPWFGFGKRNTPLAIRSVAEKIAEIKKISFEEVWRKTAENAIEFFNLPLRNV
ncbi:TatD family hydrolase [Candidatus Pacearchaeota archaeon]|nr:TatD family hydrolase [Candidatus Pacearchaeota archaeon]